MKKVMMLLFAIGLITMSNTSMAAMSNSAVRKNTRFLSDRMAYELNLSNAQYNDIYEINYDFVDAVRYIMDDVARGNDRAIDQYYYFLDIRNDDLRYVLSSSQYRRFLANETFYRPIYTSGRNWNFRVYITYSNHNYFYFGKPYHYRTYSGAHRRPGHTTVSFYHNRYNHGIYNGSYSVRNEKVYTNNRRSDFGGSITTGTSSSKSRRTSTGTATSSRRSATDDVYAPSRVSNNSSTTTNSSNNKSSTTTSSRRSTTSSGTTSGSTGSSSRTGTSSSSTTKNATSSGSSTSNSSSSRRSSVSSSSSSSNSSSSSGSSSSSSSSSRSSSSSSGSRR